ncbi:MAG: tetratricopeptide repeat protein [Victivallales bacterium]
MTKRIIAAVLIVAFSIQWVLLLADDSRDAQIKDSTDRIQKIDERVKQSAGMELTKNDGSKSGRQSVDLRERVKKRFEQDRETYSKEELREIESLYQVANKQWNSPEAQVSLKKLTDRYLKANRTGCALLYLGQMASGEEKEKYLVQAINVRSDCYYGDGVQVDAYARFHLAKYYLQIGKKDEASALFDEIRKDYPDAIDHRGRLLIDLIRGG